MDINANRAGKMRCTKSKNTWAFEPGDHIVIQIKIDGSNASVRYDPETGKLAAFSRKQQIVRTKDVDATSKFLDYVDTLDAGEVSEVPDYVFFGEWMTRQSCTVSGEISEYLDHVRCLRSESGRLSAAEAGKGAGG